MKENILIDKSIAFAARIIKLHDFLIKNKKILIPHSPQIYKNV